MYPHTPIHYTSHVSEIEITENMRARCKKLIKRATYVPLCIPVFFVLFVIGGFSSVSNKGISPLIPIGFIGFAVSGFCMAFCHAKANAVKPILDIMQKIEQIDQIPLTQLTTPTLSLSDVLYVVHKLLDSNNLPEYELIADLIIAKKTLGISPDSLMSSSLTNTVVILPTSNNKCPNCGANLDPDDKYCAYCRYHVQ